MGDVSHFKNGSVLSLLKNNVVMVGLNISRPVSEPFINFHDPNPRANDFKIRYAFKDSAYYGAYMTDIIKFLEEVDSKNVMEYLKERPEIIEKNLKTFREEMQDLKATAPVILAFGKDTHKILSENLNKNEYRKLIKPKLCAFFRSESCVSSQSEGGLKQTPCKLLVIQGLLCIKSYAQDYLWIASLEAAFLLGFRGPSQKPCLSRSW